MARAEISLAALATAVLAVAWPLPLAAEARDGAVLEFPRHPAPSPTGDEIAFSWQGDI